MRDWLTLVHEHSCPYGNSQDRSRRSPAEAAPTREAGACSCDADLRRLGDFVGGEGHGTAAHAASRQMIQSALTLAGEEPLLEKGAERVGREVLRQRALSGFEPLRQNVLQTVQITPQQ